MRYWQHDRPANLEHLSQREIMLSTRSNRFLIATLFALFLFILALLLGFNEKAASGLPPRPEPTATAVSTKAPQGAFIQLETSGFIPGPQGIWTIVQWQDNLGDWHDVSGWQGTTELDGTQRWWIAPEDLGTGPFRWTIYEAQDGDLLAASEPFDLPEQTLQTTVVSVDQTDGD